MLKEVGEGEMLRKGKKKKKKEKGKGKVIFA